MLQENAEEIIELIVRQPSPRKRAECAEEGIPLVVAATGATQRSLAGELEVRVPNAFICLLIRFWPRALVKL